MADGAAIPASCLFGQASRIISWVLPMGNEKKMIKERDGCFRIFEYALMCKPYSAQCKMVAVTGN